MRTNWRGEPANVCWMCGSTDTAPMDHSETRECKHCGNWYAVFTEEEEHDEQDAER